MLAVLIGCVLAGLPEPPPGVVCTGESFCMNLNQSYIFCYQLNESDTTKHCVKDDLEIQENIETCDLINEKAAGDSPPWNNSIASCAEDHSQPPDPVAITCKCGVIECSSGTCGGNKIMQTASRLQRVCDICTTTSTTVTTTTVTTTTTAPNYKYKGCFKDNTTRAMVYPSSTPVGNSTAVSCHRVCTETEYNYFGLQNYQEGNGGSQCYCGNSSYNQYGFVEGNAECLYEGVPRVGGSFTNAVFFISDDEYEGVCANENATRCIDFVTDRYKEPSFKHVDPDTVTGLCAGWEVPCPRLCKNISDCYVSVPPSLLERFGRCINGNRDKCSFNGHNTAQIYEKQTCPAGYSPCLDATAFFDSVEEGAVHLTDTGLLPYHIGVNVSDLTIPSFKVWLNFTDNRQRALSQDNITFSAADLNRSSSVSLMLSYAGEVQESVDVVTCNQRYVDDCNKKYCKEINLMVRVGGGVVPTPVCVRDSAPDADKYARTFTSDWECMKGDTQKTIYLGENATGTVCLLNADGAITFSISEEVRREGLYIFAGVGILGVIAAYATAFVTSR